MSQETSINDLGNNISDEDSRLVDSILNDLNGPENKSSGPRNPQIAPGQGQEGGQQLTPEQVKNIQMQRQMAMQQQQQMLMQQQQQLSQQQKTSQQNNSIENITLGDSGDIIENIKKEAKGIILVILLSIVLNLEQVDNLFKMQPGLFVSESGSINMQGILIKSLIIGVIYYLVKSYLF